MTKSELLKDLDGWTEVFIVDPITLPLVKGIYPRLRNPLVLTALSFSIGILAGILILMDQYVIGSLLFFSSIIFDGMDGKLARLVNNPRLSRIHAIFDLMLDVIRNVFVLLVMTIKFPEYSLLLFGFLGLLFIYEASYCLRLELRQRAGIVTSYSMNSLISQYSNILGKRGASAQLFGAYFKLFDRTKTLRTYPNPTIVDAEFILFVVFPFFPNLYSIILALIFLLPDVAVSLFLTIKLATREEV